jgi:hypothetical protein
MNPHAPEPNTEQITIWRNLLDAFAQLSAAWEAAAEAQRAAEAGKGPGAIAMPPDLIISFSRASREGADTLAGVAAVLSQQSGKTDQFSEVAELQRAARDAWAHAHDAFEGR